LSCPDICHRTRLALSHTHPASHRRIEILLKLVPRTAVKQAWTSYTIKCIKKQFLCFFHFILEQWKLCTAPHRRHSGAPPIYWPHGQFLIHTVHDSWRYMWFDGVVAESVALGAAI
jgi:hypothetical protein